MSGWLQRASALAWLVAAAAACVPRGDPPAGRQLVADRTSVLTGIVRPSGDGVTRVLFIRPGQAPMSVDLYVASLPADGPPSERLLGASLFGTINYNCGLAPTACYDSDALGRLFVTTGLDPSAGMPVMARLDPVTGQRLELGVVSTYKSSPNGERLIVFPSRRDDAEPTLYEADGRAVPLGATMIGTFLREDLYYLTGQRELKRIVPGGVPELLATGIDDFIPQTNQGDLLLALNRPSDSMNVFSILDTVTLEETPSPFGGGQPFSMSPDGRWFLSFDYDTHRITFVERATGAEDVFEPARFPLGGFEWRPNHDEIWFMDGEFPDPSIWIKQPGGPAVEIAAFASPFFDGSGSSSLFTHDGAYWFSSKSLPGGPGTIQIASADDPMGPRFDLAPAGTNTFDYRPLADGRLLTSGWTSTPARVDFYALDPMTGQSRLLGEAGRLNGVGNTRVLATLHVVDARGDLTVIDLATGHQTVLASEFTLGAYAEPHGADPVAPGAHVAFQFQARFASPYDGIWVATAP